jgi:hypothetical protein
VTYRGASVTVQALKVIEALEVMTSGEVTFHDILINKTQQKMPHWLSLFLLEEMITCSDIAIFRYRSELADQKLIAHTPHSSTPWPTRWRLSLGSTSAT